jgi:predicted aminopeptidase
MPPLQFTSPFLRSIRSRFRVPPIPAAVVSISLALGAAALTSCRAVHFYTQAAQGQLEIMRKAEPVAQVQQDGDTPRAVKDRLRLVEELRTWAAAELKLPAEKQYDRYTDLKRKYVVWVVYAAPEFSVEAKTWWYPILGKLKYRGYFHEADAQREAARLRAKGYDVDVSGTEAYSTLGWLRDPVLNTFLHRSDAELAELIFHELTHQLLYLPGDTDFNEALATAAGEAGAKQWLRAKGRLGDLERYKRKLRLERTIIGAILRTRQELGEIYAHHSDEPGERLRELKNGAFHRLRAEAQRLREQAGVKQRRHSPLLNNASLNSVEAYYSMLPGFERVLQECGGNIPEFLRQMEAMKGMNKEARRARIMSGVPATQVPPRD